MHKDFRSPIAFTIRSLDYRLGVLCSIHLSISVALSNRSLDLSLSTRLIGGGVLKCWCAVRTLRMYKVVFIALDR